MLKSIFYIAIIIPLICGCQGESKQEKKSDEPLRVTRQAAEYDKQESVWLIWSPVDHKEEFSNEKVQLEIVRSLIEAGQKVNISCADESICASAKEIVEGALGERPEISIIPIPSIELWTRDMGPVFVETNKGMAIADFSFDAWGYSDTTDADTKVEETYDEKVAALLGMEVISSSMVSEGGNREVNGEGTIIVTAQVEEGRNPHMSRKEMEIEYARLLGATNTIWLEKGLNEDDHTFLGPLETEDGQKAYTVVTTNGHIDEFARFVNDSTVLLAAVEEADMDDPIALENHRRMERNYEILKAARDQEGKPLKIVRMPLPKTVITTMKPGDSVYEYIKTLDYTDGSVFPEGEEIKVLAAASYLNFLIANKVVLGQKYWQEGMPEEIKVRDEKAKSILEEVFPNREVIMLDATAINLGGGGIHCITMQQPTMN